MPQNSNPKRWAVTLAIMATSTPAVAIGSVASSRLPAGWIWEITWLRATVSSLSIPLRILRKRRSPSSTSEIDDTQNGAVAVPELEELLGQCQGDVVAALALPRAAAHQLVEGAGIEGGRLGQCEDRRFDVGEVLVEGRRRRRRGASDVDDLQLPVRRAPEQIRGALQQPSAGGTAAATGDASVGGAGILGAVVHGGKVGLLLHGHGGYDRRGPMRRSHRRPS